MLTQGPLRRLLSLLAALCAGVLLTVVSASPVGADTTPLRWHRYNIADDPPSHERLSCLTNDEWRCLYDKLPERRLGFSWDPTKGFFTGTDVTSTWECPDWYPTDLCDSVTRVIAGTITYTGPQGGRFPVDAEIILTSDGTLWFSWIGLFTCPWYPTFAEALTSPADCVFNPSP